MTSEIARFTDLLRRRWFVVLLVCIVGVGLMTMVAKTIPSYKGTAKLLIVSEALKDTTLAEPDLPSILTSTEVLGRVIHRLNLDTDPQTLAKKLKTKLPSHSSILELSYKDTSPDRAVSVTNAVADETSQYFHEIATSGYADVISALNTSIAQSKAKIAEADRRLQRASANSGFASSDKALDDLTTQIDDLQVQRGQIASSLAADQATVAALQKQLQDIQPIVKGEILQKDIVYQQVQTEVGRDKADLASEKSSFQDSFPGLSALAKRVERERAQAAQVGSDAIKNGAGESASYTQTMLDLERANGVVAADEQRLDATDAQIADQQSHLRQVAGAGAAVGTLRAERDAALQQYIALTQRLSAAQGDAAQAASLGTLLVVSRAIPGPSNLWMYLCLMGLVVLALAIGTAYAFDVFDKRFWGIREIESVYGRPVLLKVGGNS
jgi:uncharacterized protein involved in exopolysaccharide biosynthesis